MSTLILVLVLPCLLTGLAWVGGRYFLGLQMPSLSLAAPRFAQRQVLARWKRYKARLPAVRERMARMAHVLLRYTVHARFGLLLCSLCLIGGIIGITLHFKAHHRLRSTEISEQRESRIAESFADETLAPALPLPPAVFTRSVTRASLCPPSRPNCDMSAQLNSYFDSAANHYHLEPALLAAIQQNEAPMNNPSIVGPVPSEGDINDRAIGLMQIRQSIARRLGIDPTNPEQSIMAAARLLSESLRRNNGNLALAVAEYHGGTNPNNWGPKTENYVRKVFEHLHAIRAREHPAGG